MSSGRSQPMVLLMHRQAELKRRAGPDIAGGRQPPAVGLDDRSADRQAHAHAAGFGGEEGVEQPVSILGGKSDTAVAYRDQHVVDFLLERSDHQFARSVRDWLNRIDAIDDEIEDYLLQLDPIAEDRAKGWGEFHPQRHPVAEQFMMQQ